MVRVGKKKQETTVPGYLVFLLLKLNHLYDWQVQALIRKALTLAEEEEEMEELRSMLEELENAQEEREGVITQLQKDRNLLVTKVRELEQAMSGFV
jgi:cell shape-determining protein MreC